MASLLAFNLVASVATANRRLVRKADATNGYLQANKITRLLIPKAPHSLAPGVVPGIAAHHGVGDCLHAKPKQTPRHLTCAK